MLWSKLLRSDPSRKTATCRSAGNRSVEKGGHAPSQQPQSDRRLDAAIRQLKVPVCLFYFVLLLPLNDGWFKVIVSHGSANLPAFHGPPSECNWRRSSDWLKAVVIIPSASFARLRSASWRDPFLSDGHSVRGGFDSSRFVVLCDTLWTKGEWGKVVWSVNASEVLLWSSLL